MRRTRSRSSTGELHARSLAQLELENAQRETRMVTELQQARGGAWSEQELIALSGLNPSSLEERRRCRAIVWWTDAGGRCFYPKWQFDGSMGTISGIEAVRVALRSDDALRVLSAFLVPQEPLEHRSILDLVLNGEVDRAVAYARAMTAELC